MYLYRRSFPRKVRRLLKEHSLYSPLTILITTRVIVIKAPQSVLVTRRNRYTLVRVPRDPTGERRRARSTIVAIVARLAKSITVVAILLYTTTIYFSKTPQYISSFVQTSLLEQRNIQQQTRSSTRKLSGIKSTLRRRSPKRVF